MKLGYTEFSFGYAFTENLLRWSRQGPTAAPYFPNLVQEGQIGYDVRIDLPASPIFFQFKLPELMVRSRAYEISQHGLPLSCDFFRMGLMRRDQSDQHRLLIDLEKSGAGPVFYASPMMTSIADFNRAYGSAEVHLKSALFSPAAIGLLPDDKNHVVSYQPNGSTGFFCSKPRPIELQSFKALITRAAAGFDEPDAIRLDQAAQRALKALREVRGRLNRIDEAPIRRRFAERSSDGPGLPLSSREREVAENLFVAHELARIGVGVEMIVAQPRVEPESTPDE